LKDALADSEKGKPTRKHKKITSTTESDKATTSSGADASTKKSDGEKDKEEKTTEAGSSKATTPKSDGSTTKKAEDGSTTKKADKEETTEPTKPTTQAADEDQGPSLSTLDKNEVALFTGRSMFPLILEQAPRDKSKQT